MGTVAARYVELSARSACLCELCLLALFLPEPRWSSHAVFSCVSFRYNGSGFPGKYLGMLGKLGVHLWFSFFFVETMGHREFLCVSVCGVAGVGGGGGRGHCADLGVEMREVT